MPQNSWFSQVVGNLQESSSKEIQVQAAWTMHNYTSKAQDSVSNVATSPMLVQRHRNSVAECESEVQPNGRDMMRDHGMRERCCRVLLCGVSAAG